MKSKLSPQYSVESPSAWLVFKYVYQKDIDPIFAGRLAALAKFIGKKINILSGYRSAEEQIAAYKNSGGKLINGVWQGGNGIAAHPGSSWHEFRLAIDTSDLWLKAMEKDAATLDQKTLGKFGLFKPLTKGNKTSVFEDWHIQPIETKGVTNRAAMAPEDYPIGEVTANILNIRIGPSATDNTDGQLHKGDKVTIYQKQGDWYLINQTKPQWVCSIYIDKK